MLGRTPTKLEKKWMDSLSELGCIVCKLHMDCYSPAEIHHIQGSRKPGCHLSTLPLCYRHHREGVKNDLYVSRHPFKTEFVKRYGTEMYLLQKVKEFL